MRVQLVTEAKVPPSWVWKMPVPGWLVRVPSIELIALGDDLVPRARFPLPEEWRATHAVTPDLRHAVLSERARIRLIDTKGCTLWEVPHHPWGNSDSESGSCWVPLSGGYVWATVPTCDGPDAWWVLDLTTGRRLAEVGLSCYAAGSDHVPHPDGVHVGLSVGEGQDGAQVYWGCWDGRYASVKRLDSETRCLIDVRPDGSQYLTTPYSTDDLLVHDFATGKVVASRAAASTFPDDDNFDYRAGYVTNDIIMACSREAQTHVVLSAADLSLIGEVDYQEEAVRELVFPTGDGRWLTCDEFCRLQLWELRT